jgi:multiple sugar transport system substrate-binding protein
MHVDDIPTNAARGVVVPIDDVAKALGLEENDFSPVLWKGSIWNGKRYGIPLDIHPLGMYYNKDVLEKGGLDPDKPPQTHDDYMAALDALKAKGIQGHWVPPFPFTGTFQFESVLWQNGGQTFSDDAKTAAFDSQAGIDAMTWLRDLVTKGYSPANVGQDADYVAFKQGKSAFCWNGIWQVADADKAPGLHYGVAPIPQIGTKQKAAWTNAHMFTLIKQKSNDTNKMAAAQTFINWISTNSLEWAKSGKVPARASVRDSAGFKAVTELQPFAEELPYVHFPALAPGVSDAAAQIDIAVSNAILGKKSVADALHSAAQQANKVLKDNASKYGTGS